MNSRYPMGIPTLSSQSERAKIDIHLLNIYYRKSCKRQKWNKQTNKQYLEHNIFRICSYFSLHSRLPRTGLLAPNREQSPQRSRDQNGTRHEWGKLYGAMFLRRTLRILQSGTVSKWKARMRVEPLWSYSASRRLERNSGTLVSSNKGIIAPRLKTC